ncbi:MAG: EamA family transporter [Anaerolineales bacterium]|nr:EamA family transporter [Anaerolineales bacterium]
MPNAKSQAAVSPSENLRGLLLVVFATLCWSTSGIFINLITDATQISAVSLAFWRDLSTFLILLGSISLLRPRDLKVNLQDLPWLIGMGGISIGIFHILWNTSVVVIGASLATVMQSNAPIFVTIMAWFLFDEPLTARKITAVLLAAIGTTLIGGIHSSGNMQVTTSGLLIALGSALTYGTLSLFGKKLSKDYQPWTILLYIFGFGTLTLLPFQLNRSFPSPINVETFSLFLGFLLISTLLGFGMYTAGLQKLQASVASITATTEILFAYILAYFFLSERLDFWQIFGSLLIISGVVLVSLQNQKQHPKGN